MSEGTASKKRSVRYCILCGIEIGDATHCPNPDCGGAPNFYRHVPGPEHGKDGAPAEPDGREPVDREKPLLQPRAARSVPREREDRQTMPLSAGPVALLRATSAPHEEFHLNSGTTLVGARSPAKIVIDRPDVSSRHATIGCRKSSGGEWKLAIIDHQSTNGTFVNGRRIRRCSLKPDDRIRFASAEYELRLFSVGDSPRVTMQM